jgi:hypothetical protein
MTWRESLEKLGFVGEGEDMVIRWQSRPNARGERVCCEIDQAFRDNASLSWWVSKPNGGGWVLPAQSSEECLRALLGEMGIPTNGGGE